MKPNNLMSILVLVIIGCANVSAIMDCRNQSFVILNNKEYEIFFEKETHRNAQRKCVRWGRLWKSDAASLAHVVDEDTQECLTQMIEQAEIRHDFGDLFLGGTKKAGNWLWNDGSPIVSNATEAQKFNKWEQGYPSNTPNKDCLSMKKSGGKWVEKECNSKLYYICERVITEDRLWGYYQNQHSLTPENWPRKYGSCGGKRQSPVDIPVNLLQLSKSADDSSNLSTVADWVLADNVTGDVTWTITNTGRMIKLTPVKECSVYTTFVKSDEKLCLDRIELKWGNDSHSGSDHTIGKFQLAGELQFFHQPKPGTNEIHALAFMLQQRSFVPNENWSHLLRHLALVQETNATTEIKAPVGMLRKMLGDTAPNRRYATPESISYFGIRYRGSLTTPPCDENVIWTVYPRPISLNHSQFFRLRLTHMEGKIGNRPRYLRETTRNIQRRAASFYLVARNSKL